MFNKALFRSKYLFISIVLLSFAISFSSCRTKKNVKSPMGWLSHKKLKKYEIKTKKNRSKKQTKIKMKTTQLWYRDWLKDKNKK